MKTLYERIEERSIKHHHNLLGKKILLRLDINVPLGENNKVDEGEDWRIQRSLETLNFLVEQKACVVVLAHAGHDGATTLKPMVDYLSRFVTLGFGNINDDTILERINGMPHGSVIVMENLRAFPGEEANQIDFLTHLVNVSDMYVNDAFSVSHRNHASVSQITKHLPSYFGLQFVKEIEELSKILDHNDKKMTLVLGGAKFGTKLRLLEKMLPQIQFALIGGAAANVFLQARGFNIGNSYVDDNVDVSSMRDNEKIILPIDCVDQEGDVVSIDEIRDNDSILDIGHETEQLFESIIDDSDIVLWNGPMGKYEDGYISGSVAIADAIGRSRSYSVTGGGDTATVIIEHHNEDAFDFISTGGGAMLDFLVDGTLIGIKAILEKTSE